MKKVTLLGFICLALMLTAMSFGACAPQTAAPAAPPVTVTVTVTATPTQQMFSVLDPRGIEPDRPVFGLSPRLPTLDGKTVNVINLHGGNEQAFVSLATDLQAAVPACKVVYFRTDGGFGGNALTTDDWAKMTKCDAAVLGHNFWGGTASFDGGVAAQMERKGIPVVVETWNTPDIIGITQKAALFGGVPEIRQVPTTPDTALTSLKQWLPDIIKGLTTPLTDKEKWAGTYKPEVRPRILMTGTYDEVQAYYEGDLGRFPAGTPPHALMTDGTPVTPPTEEAVARMLKGTSHKPNEVVNPKFLPNEYVATVEKVAINGVMAGCKPEYMPVLLAIAEAGAAVGCQWDWDFGSMFVVSGPIGKEIGMNSYFQALTPVGNPANASLTRAAALMGINLGGWAPIENAIERIGANLWSLTFAEATDRIPSGWEGLNVDCGYNSNNSVLVAFNNRSIKVDGACVSMVQPANSLFELQNGSPQHLVTALESNHLIRNAMVIFTPDTAKIWHDQYGFKTVQQLQDYLYDNVTQTRKVWGDLYFFYMTSQAAKANPRGSRMINPDHLDAPPDALVPMIVNGPEAIKIIVTGGLGTQWGWGGMSGAAPRGLSIDKWR